MSDTAKTPEHIGIILDGNRRWARARGLLPFEGHTRGVEQIRPVLEQAFQSGVKFVSLYVFSTENWKRKQEEVSHLMGLFTRYFKKEARKLIKSGVRVKFAGQREDDRLSADIKRAIVELEAQSEDNSKGTVVFCFNYGGHTEIMDAIKKLIDANVNSQELDSSTLEAALYHPDVPPVDLVIRTSGENRISNFQLWRLAYSEFVFVEKHWPDFTPKDLLDVLDEFTKRDRRFGGS